MQPGRAVAGQGSIPSVVERLQLVLADHETGQSYIATSFQRAALVEKHDEHRAVTCYHITR